MSEAPAAPCFDQLRKALYNQPYKSRVPLYEWSADSEIVAAILGRPLPAPSVDAPAADSNYWDLLISFYYQLGYDYVPVRVANWATTTYRYEWAVTKSRRIWASPSELRRTRPR